MVDAMCKKRKKSKKVAIIGGGAAGMMCAATLIEKGFSGDIALFERNASLGAKVIISGGGRCNVTTGITSLDVLVTKYPRGGTFLRDALKAFGPAKIRAWFEAHDVPLREEDDRRVFPCSNNGKDIVRVFEKIFATTPTIRCLCKTSVLSVEKSDNQFCITYKDKNGTRHKLYDIVVLTTGGNAYAHTGSRGDGYAFARALGHTITPLGPSLNSFLVREAWIKELSGTSFPHARLYARRANGEKVDATGPLLLTHFGISGPAAFAFAAGVAHEKIDESAPLHVRICIDATRDYHTWQKLLIDACAADGAHTIVHILKRWMTTRFAYAMCRECGIDVEKKCAELSKKERKILAHFLGDGYSVRLYAKRPGDEFVTAGGVSLSEVSPKTCASRIACGVYFAGEILDIDGVTGGFNLTASWATGYVAGRAIVRNK